MPSGFTRDEVAAIAALAHLELDASEIDIALLSFGARRHRDNADTSAAARRQRAAFILDEAEDFGTDRAEPRNTHFEGGDHSVVNSRKDYRRLARGTTLCNVSSPLSRKRRTPRAA